MIRIRKATEQDAAHIVEIKNEIARNTTFFLRSQDDDEEREEDYRRKIGEREKKGGLTIVAEEGGKVIGFLSFSRVPYVRFCHTGTFGMGVKRDFRGSGAGSSLLQYLIRWGIEEEGLEKIDLEVFSHNEKAIRLYQKFGFCEEGRQRKGMKIREEQYSDVIFMGLFV
ncbi:GNAT family acetyltransferase [Bacillus endophyticus]|uniref:GNAT family N-acetyltransferase n=1 Tax=Priestia endophytica TaxID=135735 RepID=UPI0018CC806A|nr:GNAT family N-acetyltransferase [Priestia endophytica]MBG9813987.1 GNAT family acetyltransferase [Priestia endophytica]